MNKLPDKDKEYLYNVELVKDLLTMVMSRAIKAPPFMIDCNYFLAYLEVHYMDSVSICGELQDYLDAKHLNRYMDADYVHRTDMYDPSAIITLCFKKEYVNEIKEIITMYKLAEG